MSRISKSKKFKRFIKDPYPSNWNLDLPGIGTALGTWLQGAEFDSASSVVGLYMLVNGDKEAFLTIMKKLCPGNSRQLETCWKSIHLWSRKFM